MRTELMRTIFGALVAAVLLSSSTLVAETAAERFEGRPTFSEGKALGYFVWKDGDTWKLRWTTFGAQHRFNGRVTVEGGAIKSFKRVDVDEERRVIRPGRAPHAVRGPRGRVRGVTGGRAPIVAERTEDRIEQENENQIQWFTRTDDDVDGLEFKLSDDARLLRFVLEIDGVPRPAEVEIGRTNARPEEHPLVVRIK